MLILEIRHLQDVEPDRVVNVHWIKVDDVVGSLRRNLREHLFHELTMRINDPDSAARADILQGHVFQKHSLACAGLTDNVGMLAPVFHFDPENPLRSAEISAGEKGGSIVVDNCHIFNYTTVPIGK